jgi:hypothetical protein
VLACWLAPRLQYGASTMSCGHRETKEKVMKREKNKNAVVLKRESIRILSNEEAKRAVGGDEGTSTGDSHCWACKTF